MDRKTGLYSKAAQIIRSLPQERGTAEQMIAAAKKAGVKDAELAHARPPTGKISREELAQHFEQNLPKLRIDQYGENPNYLSRDENQRRIALQNRSHRGEELTPEERAEADRLQRRVSASPNVQTREDEDTGAEEPLDTEYGDYVLSGGKNYRERLLKLDRPKDLRQPYEDAMRKAEVMASAWPEGHPRRQQFEEQANEFRRKLATMPERTQPPAYQSSHWSGHPNVLAHIRLSDREVGPTSSFAEAKQWVMPVLQKIADHMGTTPADLGSGAAKYAVQNGLITPEEAATLTQIKGWQNEFTGKKGLGKRLLHVEELQSDWAQEGRDKGFNDGSAMKAYRDHIEDMRGRMRQSLLDQGMREEVARPLYENAEPWHLAKFHGEEDKLNALRDATIDQQGKVPTGPYVTNTQHWTDLALKNVLREAALGNYDGIVFTPGQAQADRYGLEKQVDSIKYWPQDRTLSALQGNSTRIAKPDVDPEDLPSLIGKELSEKLLHPSSARTSEFDGSTYHMLQGDDMKVGGQGMKGYYDNIVPKSVMNLARQHDPSIQPAEPVQLPEGYQGFHLPMTDQLKQSVLDKGFPAFRRGGKVDRALAVTRRFTKDGAGAMMRLKP